MIYVRHEYRFRFVAALVSAALLALTILAGRGSQPSASASQLAQREDKHKDPRYIAEGEKLFAPACSNAYCHGAGGAGGVAPALRGKDLPAGYLFKAISNGIPGTTMLSFKSEFSEEQIWKLVAFILSDAKTGSAAKIGDKPASSSSAAWPSSTDAAAALLIVGSVQAGKALFFDSAQSKSCHACHSFADEGTPIGPDLSKAGTRSARELFLSIILARQTKDLRYATLTVTLRNGDRIVGVKKEEDAESIRVYDTTELPAVLRTVQKVDIAKIETTNDSVMPKDYALTYSLKQLLDLVTFLKSSDPQPKSPVTLKDLF